MEVGQFGRGHVRDKRKEGTEGVGEDEVGVVNAGERREETVQGSSCRRHCPHRWQDRSYDSKDEKERNPEDQCHCSEHVPAVQSEQILLSSTAGLPGVVEGASESEHGWNEDGPQGGVVGCLVAALH